MGSKKTKSTQVSTPNVPTFISGPQQSYMGNVNSLMGDWSKGVTGPTAQQQQAFGFRGSEGTGAMKGLLGGGISSDLVNFDPGTIAGSDLSQYTNPYETSVIGNATRDMDTARQRQIANSQAAATAAGAFGGARHGVADSLTNDAYFQNVGDMTSNLRYQGYNNAQQAAQQDIANRLNGAQFRLGAQNTLFGNQYNAANGLAGNERADLGLMADLGEQERQLQARANPNSVESLQAMSGLLGYNPAMYVGNTTNTTQKTSGGGFGQVLGGLGTLAMGLGTGGLGFAPLAGLGAKSLGGAAGFTPGWGSGLFGSLK